MYPARFYPFDDELLSSWLVRLAWANGRKTQRLFHEILPTRRTIVLNADLDWCLHSELFFASLIIKFGLRRTTLERHQLSKVVLSSLTEDKVQRSLTRMWITLVRKHHERRDCSGLSYCPKCLSEDEIPYFRKLWKFSWYTVCPYHGENLLETCPKCKNHIDFHLYNCGKEVHAELFLGHIAHCGHCGADLTKLKAMDPADEINLAFQEKIQKVYQKGLYIDWRHQWNYSHAYFSLLRHLLQLIQSSSTLRPLVVDLGYTFDIDETGKSRMSDFDHIEIERRRKLLAVLAKLLMDFPKNLIEYSQKHKISSSYWLTYNRKLPLFFSLPIDTYLNRSWYTPTEVELDSVKNYLLRNGLPTHHYNVRRWLGRYYPSNHSMELAKKKDGYDF